MKILLKGVETYRRDAVSKNKSFEWKENGRRYSLFCKENVAGNFILCSMTDADGKRQTFLLERKGPDRGLGFVGKSSARSLCQHELRKGKGAWHIKESKKGGNI